MKKRPSQMLMSFNDKRNMISDQINDITSIQNQSYFTDKQPPQNHRQRLYERDLSVRSVSTNKKPQLSRISQRSAFDLYYQQTHITEQARNHYDNIERILKSQNSNLKKQNNLLLTEVSRLKNLSRKYKETCHTQRIQIQELKQQCEAQRRRADEMKQIIMTRLKHLETKALNTGETNSSPLENSQVFLEGLSLSESGVKQQS